MPRKKATKPPTPSPSPELPDDDASAAGTDDESSDDEEEEVYVEPLLATRGRRANAGNRMQALIEDEAQAEVEEMFKEEEGDDEFAQKEEKDEFDSDFGSTDEGEGNEEDDEEAGERRLQRETKEAKKAAKGKKKGFQAPVHPFARQTKGARTKAAREAEKQKQGGAVASTSASTLDDAEGAPARKRKKVAVDPSFLVPQRESSRRTAVEGRKQIEARKERESREKKTTSKPSKKPTVHLTQADLIAEALETEEVNRAALLAFYAAEEDRREQERIAGMRYEIIGAKLTFLSRAENRTEDAKKGKGKEKVEKGRRRLIEVVGESGQAGWKAGAKERGEGQTVDVDSATAVTVDPVASGSTSLAAHPPSLAGILNSRTASPSSTPAPHPFSPEPEAPPERTEFTRNWLIFGNTDEEPITRKQELEAIFGEHEDWERERPRPTKGVVDGVPGRGALCPLTGLPAKYLDPRTLTPYANLAAYRLLTSLVDSQTSLYSDSLGAYTANVGLGLAREVEIGWSKRPGGGLRSSVSGVAGAPVAASPAGAGPGQPMIGASTPVPLSRSASSGGPAGAGGAKKPRAPRQSLPAQQQQQQVGENPYKVEYAHSGGSGRGARGRGSSGGAGAAEGGAYPQQQQYQHQHQQEQQPYDPYAQSGVYGAGVSPFQQQQQQQYPPHQQQHQQQYQQPFPPAHQHSPSPFHPPSHSPSLQVGSSTAPQARSIPFPSRVPSGAGSPFGRGSPSPAPFLFGALPALPKLPPLPRMGGTGGSGQGGQGGGAGGGGAK
ncbi:hypothetical protein JCM8547_008371 [Rhodosporidiobolus lusitaniae]